MNDADIIKALECCGEQKCWECPNEPKENKKGTFGCSWEMMLATLDLIKRQKAEIERWQEECGKQSVLWRSHFESIFESAKEVVRAEAITEFAERLCEGRVSNDPVVIAVKVELEMMKEGVNNA